MSALEDTTKQHYIYFFDPEYVTQMRVPGFDPHLDIGLLSKRISKEEEQFYKYFKKTKKEEPNHVFTVEEEQKFHAIDGKRSKSKTINFACTYGAGPAKISKTSGMSLSESTFLHKVYWERNKAVKKVANSFLTKEIEEDNVIQKWLFNPVSCFWYSLREEKDKFSTGNQSSAVYCFDSWVNIVRSKGIRVSFQYHDEILFPLLKVDREEVTKKLNDSIKELNQKIVLNVPLGISIDFGTDYSKVH